MGRSRLSAVTALSPPLMILRASALMLPLLVAGCASTHTLLASQATRAACAPTSGRSKIEFQVVGPEGRGLPNVQVTLNGMTNGALHRASDVSGWVSIEVPRPGTYGAHLELRGFQRVKIDSIKVATRCQVKLLVVLTPSRG